MKQKKNLPVKTGQNIEILINGLGSSGEGVGRYKELAIFVPGALPGEKVQAKITLVKKKYAVGCLNRILEVSPDRVKPVCPIYNDCGGCQLQHLSYNAQLKYKRQKVEDALKRLGHLNVQVLPVIGSDSPWYYRNKMQFPASGCEGSLAIGCYASATHRVIDADGCMIQKEGNNAVLQAVRHWMKDFAISAYNELTGKGLIRHVMGRVGVSSGQVMAVLVTSAYDIPHRRELFQYLRKGVPGLVSIVQNINKKPGNIIMGNKSRALWGESSIKDSLGDLNFNISDQSFFQVNSEQADKLYNKALEYAALTGKETVVDIYCGTGTISLYLAKHAKKVFGIEIVEAAIADAKINAQENACENVEFILGDAAEALPKLLDAGVKPQVVLLDPPRGGSEEKVLAAIAHVKPDRIVYVSCNPATLARDLAYLAEQGYELQKVQPVEMFPMTTHIESVALMSKK